VDLDRRGEDPHAGHGPKLIVTGRLSGTAEGCPVDLIGDGAALRVVLPGLVAAWRLRRRLLGGRAAASFLHRLGLGLTIDVGVATFPVLPHPHPLVRWFAPELSVS